MIKNQLTEQKRIYIDSLQVIFNMQSFHFKSAESKNSYDNLISNNLKNFFINNATLLILNS